jgi:hypothetical protein
LLNCPSLSPQQQRDQLVPDSVSIAFRSGANIPLFKAIIRSRYIKHYYHTSYLYRQEADILETACIARYHNSEHDISINMNHFSTCSDCNTFQLIRPCGDGTYSIPVTSTTNTFISYPFKNQLVSDHDIDCCRGPPRCGACGSDPKKRFKCHGGICGLTYCWSIDDPTKRCGVRLCTFCDQGRTASKGLEHHLASGPSCNGHPLHINHWRPGHDAPCARCSVGTCERYACAIHLNRCRLCWKYVCPDHAQVTIDRPCGRCAAI